MATPLRRVQNTQSATATADTSNIKVWAILSDVLPPIPAKTIYCKTPSAPSLFVNSAHSFTELQQKPRMVFKTITQKNQNTGIIEDYDSVRLRFLDPNTTHVHDTVTFYILNKTEHLPISYNLIYNFVLRVKPKKSHNTPTPGAIPDAPKQDARHTIKAGGQKIRRGNSNRYPVFDSHGSIGVSSSTANETKDYEYAYVVIFSASATTDTKILHNPGANVEMFYPLITPRMIKNEKVLIPTTPTARAAITEILMNTWVSMRSGWFSEQSLTKGSITDAAIQDLETKYGIPLDLSTRPMTILSLCRPTYGLFTCDTLVDHRSTQCNQFLDWINTTIRITNPKNIMSMIRDKNSSGSLVQLVAKELEETQDLDIIMAMLSNWFKHFRTLEQKMADLTLQPRISVPWFNATLGHTRRARMVFNCARNHPLLFVQLEPLFIKQQQKPKGQGQGVTETKESIHEDATSFYSISLLEWIPHIKHVAFMMKDLHLDTPFFSSISSVIDCIGSLRGGDSSSSSGVNDALSKARKIQDSLMLASLDVGVRFVKYLFSTGSDIAYKLPTTVRYNSVQPIGITASMSNDSMFTGSPILDIAIEILLTTPPLKYSYICDIVPPPSPPSCDNVLNKSTHILANYGISSKLYCINNRRSDENLFLLKSPTDMEWFNLPPIIKTVNESVPGVVYYQTREQYIAKSTILSHIHSLYSRVSELPKWEPSYTASGSILTKEQQCALNSIDTTPITMIVGGPGVGKTFVAQEIFRKYGFAQTRLMGYTGALVSHLRSVISPCLESNRDRDATKGALNTIDLAIDDVVHMVHEHYITKYKNPVTRDTRSPFGHTAPIRIVIIDEVPMFDNRTLAMALSLYTETQTRLVFLADENQIGSIGLGSVFKQFREYYQEQQENTNIIIENDDTNGDSDIGRKRNVPPPLLNMITLTENFRLSKTEASKDLKELASLYERGRSTLIFDFNQLTEKTGGLESFSGGVHFIKLIEATSAAMGESIKSVKDVIPEYFFKHSQDTIHLLSTMFLTFTRITRTQVNDVVSSILIRTLIPELMFNNSDTIATAMGNSSQNNLPTTEPSIIYFVGQRVMIEGKNFHNARIHPSLHLFNGELYTVAEIISIPSPPIASSIPPQKDEDKKTQHTPLLGEVIGELNRVTKDAPKYNYVTKPQGVSMHLKLNDSKKKETLMVESFIMKLQKWPITNTSRYKYIIVTANPTKPPFSSSTTPDQSRVFSLCPVLEKRHLVESWAMTVNKTQGCEFNKVCLVIQNGTEETKHFSTGHGLVAISRARDEFTLISHASDALDTIKNMGESGNGSLFFGTQNNTEVISDLKTHLLSPTAPWRRSLPNITIINESTDLKRGIKRSRNTNT